MDQLPYKRTPRAYQVEALKRAYDLQRFALFMEMGTGKTKVAIDLACLLFQEQKITTVVVFCPKSIREDAWGSGFQVDKWDGIDADLYIPNGSGVKKADAINALRAQAGNGALQILILNYDSLLSPAVQRELKALTVEQKCLFLCDESTCIKNAQAKRSKALYRLRQGVPYRGILTGSPVTESPKDAFGQYLFIDPSVFGGSFVAFRAQFCVMGGYQGKQILGYQNLDVLKKKLYTRAYRVAKADCLDLPAKIYMPTRKYELSDEQKSWHSDMAKEMLVELDNGMTFQSTIVLTKFRRLQEICSGYLKQGEDVHRSKSNPKLDELLDVLDESSDKKVIVWCNEREEIRLVVEALEKRGDGVISQIHGDIKDRQEQIDRFKQAPDKAYMVMNYQSGSMGLTLVEATMAIFFGSMFSAKDREQAEDRCHRIGQTQHVTYVDLVATKSIEEYVLKVLKSKKAMASDLVELKKELAGYTGLTKQEDFHNGRI